MLRKEQDNQTIQKSPVVVNRLADRMGEKGSSLVEVVCALVIILVALLGVAFAISYSITSNAGNASRAKALAVLQQEVEQLRAAKFTPAITDAALRGGTRPTRSVVAPTGEIFTVSISVDNNPLTAGIQDDTEVPAPTYKEIIVTTRLANLSPGWQMAVPAIAVLRRARAN